MPKFLAVHPLPVPMSIEEAAPIAKGIAGLISVDAYWLGSWVQLNAEGKAVKVFCRWNRSSAEVIKKILAKTPQLPTAGVYPMMTLDSGDFM